MTKISDYIGISEDIRVLQDIWILESFLNNSKIKALVLGNGGVSKSICYVLQKKNIEIPIELKDFMGVNPPQNPGVQKNKKLKN